MSQTQDEHDGGTIEQNSKADATSQGEHTPDAADGSPEEQPELSQSTKRKSSEKPLSSPAKEKTKKQKVDTSSADGKRKSNADEAGSAAAVGGKRKSTEKKDSNGKEKKKAKKTKAKVTEAGKDGAVTTEDEREDSHGRKTNTEEPQAGDKKEQTALRKIKGRTPARILKDNLKLFNEHQGPLIPMATFARIVKNMSNDDDDDCRLKISSDALVKLQWLLEYYVFYVCHLACRLSKYKNKNKRSMDGAAVTLARMIMAQPGSVNWNEATKKQYKEIIGEYDSEEC